MKDNRERVKTMVVRYERLVKEKETDQPSPRRTTERTLSMPTALIQNAVSSPPPKQVKKSRRSLSEKDSALSKKRSSGSAAQLNKPPRGHRRAQSMVDAHLFPQTSNNSEKSKGGFMRSPFSRRKKETSVSAGDILPGKRQLRRSESQTRGLRAQQGAPQLALSTPVLSIPPGVLTKRIQTPGRDESNDGVVRSNGIDKSPLLVASSPIDKTASPKQKGSWFPGWKKRSGVTRLRRGSIDSDLGDDHESDSASGLGLPLARLEHLFEEESESSGSDTISHRTVRLSRLLSNRPNKLALVEGGIFRLDQSIYTVRSQQPLVAQTAMYHVENGINSELFTTAEKVTGFVDPMADVAFYRDFIHSHDHVTFLGGDDSIGPVVVSIEKPVQGGGAVLPLHAMVRTRDGDHRVVIAGGQHKLKKALKAANVNFTAKTRFRKATNGNTKLHNELLNMEDVDTRFNSRYKFGVVCANGEDQTENELFQDDSQSADLDEFMACLGTRIPLQGWDKFAGGLDVKTDSTGTESYYATCHDKEVMFHVASMLPYFSKDEQQVERKRHIGNDVVVIVFLGDDSESGDDEVGGGKKKARRSFSPDVFTSHFVHIVVVVRKVSRMPDRQPAPTPAADHDTDPGAAVQSHADAPPVCVDADANHTSTAPVYRIEFAFRHGMSPFPPFVAETPVFQAGEHMKEWILRKLINAERTAMRTAPEFIYKIRRTRAEQLQLLIGEHTDPSSPGVSL